MAVQQDMFKGWTATNQVNATVQGSKETMTMSAPTMKTTVTIEFGDEKQAQQVGRLFAEFLKALSASEPEQAADKAVEQTTAVRLAPVAQVHELQPAKADKPPRKHSGIPLSAYNWQSIESLAQLLGIHQRTVRQRTQDGKVERIKYPTGKSFYRLPSSKDEEL